MCVYSGLTEKAYRELFVPSFEAQSGTKVTLDPGWWDMAPKLKVTPSDQSAFDLVMTDMWMPKMNGRDLVAKIRRDERFADLPVYAVTADTEERKTFEKHGFTGLLLKPLTIDKLSGLFS